MDMDGLNNYFTKVKYELPGIKYARGDELDNLILTARVEPNPAKRIDYFKKVVSIINEDVNHIYTNVDIHTVAFKNDLKNVKADMAKYYRFSEWGY
jgi:ABC-type transport system substrate-binding protein